MIKTKQNINQKSAVHLPVVSLNLTIMATLLLLFVFLGATSYLYMHPSVTNGYGKESNNAYRQALEKSFQQENTEQEWKQLYKYHGNPTLVIYEKGKTPYFYNKQGAKCAFVFPPKGTEPVYQQANGGEYSVAMMSDRKPLPE